MGVAHHFQRFQVMNHLFRRNTGAKAVGPSHDEHRAQMKGDYILFKPFHHHGTGVAALRQIHHWKRQIGFIAVGPVRRTEGQVASAMADTVAEDSHCPAMYIQCPFLGKAPDTYRMAFPVQSPYPPVIRSLPGCRVIEISKRSDPCIDTIPGRGISIFIFRIPAGHFHFVGVRSGNADVGIYGIQKGSSLLPLIIGAGKRRIAMDGDQGTFQPARR